MGGFDTIEDAAQAGITTIQQNEDSKRREFIGLIYQDPESGKFLITEPRGQGKKGKAKSGFKIPKGSARGIFHNHPFDLGNARDAESANFFSLEDMAIAEKTGLKSFIGVGDDLLLWDPANPGKKSREGRGSRLTVRGEGTSVLAKIAMDLLPQRRVPKVAKR